MDKKELNPDFAADLLGYHLGILEEESVSRVKAAFGNTAELEAVMVRVQRQLAPLDADVFETPSDLTQRILRRIEQGPAPLSFPKVAAGSAVEIAQGGRGGSFLAMRELIGLAAAIVLFVGIFVPGYRTARDAAQKVACANNMRTIAGGYANYNETYGGHLPFAGVSPGTPWCATDDGFQSTANNSSHAYLLVQRKYVPASAFFCPAREGDFAMTAQNFDEYTNFLDVRNNSYATNLMTSPWKKGVLQSNMPLVGDMSPLVDEDRRLIQDGPPPANSTSHGRLGGQSVMRLDGSVGFYQSPKVGVEQDDIYRLQNVNDYKGTETPKSTGDTFLVP